MHRQEVENNTILLALTGSRGYGIENPDSDYDYKGICLANLSHYLGNKKFQQKANGWDSEEPSKFSQLTSTDSCIFEFTRYCDLALDANPNIIELLWFDRYEYLSNLGAELILRRNWFLSTKVKHTYSGYAYAQIKKAETHRSWLKKAAENPEYYNKLPDPKDYGLEENPLRKEQLHSFLEFLAILIRDAVEYYELSDIIENLDVKGYLKQYPLKEELLPMVQEYTRSTNDFIRLLHSTQQYNKALNDYNAYHSWKANRNVKRSELEASIGYDSKHLGHCYRLLKTAIEILNFKVLIVNRREAGDADYIKSIRNGEVPYEDLMDQVNHLKDVLLPEALNNTTLSKYPNREEVEDFQIHVLKKYILNL